MRSLLLRLLAIAVVLMCALRVLGAGFLPFDDALRHAAKAVAGRPWSEILLLRPGFTLDSNPGWHAILGALHRTLGLGTVDLVLVSVVLLFVLFSLGPLLLLRRPEAWLLALLVLNVVDPGVLVRLLCGRPFLLSSAIVPLVCLLWDKLEQPAPSGILALFVVCGALASWVHGAFYLLALPVLALLLAGRTGAASRLGAAFAVGILVGAAFTGHPLGHLVQMLRHGWVSVGEHRASEALVGEFMPFDGRASAVLALVGLLAYRVYRRGDAAVWRDPSVVMTVLGWTLGYVAARFWSDWALPAFLAVFALAIERELVSRQAAEGRARLVLFAGAAALLLVAFTADVQARWSQQPTRLFLSRDDPTQAEWLPDPGGIVYSADLTAFYATFFRNPDAPWHYVLGFEPALMRPEDYAVYSAIRRSHGATEAFLPWVSRMRPADRLYVTQRSNTPPAIPGLEWYQPVFGIWSGRLPRRPPSGGPGPEGGRQP